MNQPEKVRCSACGWKARPIHANHLRIGEHRTTEMGNLQIAAQVIDTCDRCNADMGITNHTIIVPIAHQCPEGKIAEWGQPAIHKRGMRPDVGWYLDVTVYCHHCGQSETLTYPWLLEKAPPVE